MLEQFVTVHRVDIIDRCNAKVALRSELPVTIHGVPLFLDQLIEELQHGPTSNIDISETARRHGQDMQKLGFSPSQVVHAYGDVCQSITELAGDLQADISLDDFRMLNRCLDDAIAGAVTQYSAERFKQTANNRVALALELQGAIARANIAFDAIRVGNIGVSGGTGVTLAKILLEAGLISDRLVSSVE